MRDGVARMKIWLNGQLCDRSDARINVLDAGIQHGVGLFETMLARDGAVLRMDQHLLRLETSAQELGLAEALRVDPLGEAVLDTLAANDMRDARIRLTVTGGDLGLPWTRKPEDRTEEVRTPTIMIVAQPPTAYPEELFERGVAVTVSASRHSNSDRFLAHKSLWYWPRIEALGHAARVGCTESLWFSTQGFLAAGSVSNVFLVKDGVLSTPIARGDDEATEGEVTQLHPVLPGCTRMAVMEWALTQSARVRIRNLTIEEVVAADEIFMTNSSWGVLPVVRVEDAVIGKGTPGLFTQSMRERWLA